MPPVRETQPLWRELPFDPEQAGVWALVSDDGWWVAELGRSGCIDLRRYFNVPYGDEGGSPLVQWDESVHICDLDPLIERLTALRDPAREHYGDPDWGKD